MPAAVESAVRPFTATRAPQSRSVWAAARPMPRDEPVTRTVLLVKSISVPPSFHRIVPNQKRYYMSANPLRNDVVASICKPSALSPSPPWHFAYCSAHHPRL
jgi:hypothetical protein